MKNSAGSSKTLGQKHRKKGNDTSKLEALQAQKEQFLRHPSLRTTDRERHNPQANTVGTRASNVSKDRPSHVARSMFAIQEWNSLAREYTKPPPRPPRPPSDPVPAVIVTPCTPTGDGLLSSSQDFPYTTTRVSPLDLTIAAYKPGQGLTPHFSAAAKHQRKDTRPIDDAKPGSDPPDVSECDIADVTVIDLADVQNPFNVTPLTPLVDSPHVSFVLPEPLRSITFDPARHSTNVLSAISGLIWDTPSWISAAPSSDSEPLNTRATPYVTSTPAKRRRAGERDLESDSIAATLRPNDVGKLQRLRLPEDQMDLLPYPDVFDLDMYYGPGSGRDSLSTQDCSSSSIIICSTEDKDLFSLLDLSLPSNSDHIPTRSARRFGFVAAPSSPQSPSVSVDHEVKRYRDLYRHPAYSRPPDLYSENTSLESLMNVTPPAHNKAPVSGSASRALLPLPLRDANRTTNIPSRPLIPARKVGKVHFETTPPRPLKLVKSHHANPPPPIVIVSHHRCGSISEDSRYTMKVNNSEGSQETLRARLREACANFSKSVWTEDSYSLDISIR